MNAARAKLARVHCCRLRLVSAAGVATALGWIIFNCIYSGSFGEMSVRVFATGVGHFSSAAVQTELTLGVSTMDRLTRGIDTAVCNRTRVLRPDRANDTANLTGRVGRWIDNANAFIECPVALTHSASVPRVLHRIWECAEIPDAYASSVASWGRHADGMIVALWTEELRQRFARKMLGPGKLGLYQRLIPGAYRADLFKYIVMYYIGGIYSDLDATLLMGLGRLGYLFSGTTLCDDLLPGMLHPGALMMAPPGRVIFVCAAMAVFRHSKNRDMGASDLHVTGPGVLGACARYTRRARGADLEPVGGQGVRRLHSRIPAGGSHTFYLAGGKALVRLQPGGATYPHVQRPECDPGEHYSVLYRKGEIYRTDTLRIVPW